MFHLQRPVGELLPSGKLGIHPFTKWGGGGWRRQGEWCLPLLPSPPPCLHSSQLISVCLIPVVGGVKIAPHKHRPPPPPTPPTHPSVKAAAVLAAPARTAFPEPFPATKRVDCQPVFCGSIIPEPQRLLDHILKNRRAVSVLPTRRRTRILQLQPGLSSTERQRWQKNRSSAAPIKSFDIIKRVLTTKKGLANSGG